MTTTRAAVYLRISLDATGEGLGVARQREDCLKLAKDRGWTVVEEYVDNSISASDSRKARPAYDKLANDFEAGKFDVLVCYDLDRLTRQPRQLEDWIDASEQHGLLLAAVTGDANLETDNGRMFARVKLGVARAEVERKSARQKRAQAQRASLGKPPKGVRATGYTLGGEIVEEEAVLIRDIFDSFAAGDTLKGIASRLAESGVPTRRGGQWSSSSVSSILRNPRYAGRSTYKTTHPRTKVVTVNTYPATWEAIVPPDQFDAVASRLADPTRKTRGDTARKHLGSGVYLCECGLPIRASSGNGILTRYTCRHACFYRSAGPVDAYVLAVVRGRLALPDLAEILARPSDGEAAKALAAERDRLQRRLVKIGEDYDAELLDGAQYRKSRDKVLASQEAVQKDLNRLIASDASSSVLGAPDPVAAFDAAPLAIRQRIIGVLASVTLHPGRRGVKAFDPDTVTIEWRVR